MTQKQTTAVQSIKKGEIIILDKPRYGMAVSWDKLKHSVDLDLQAVMVDKRGTIVDAVYYNNLCDTSKSVFHSGDEATGEAGGYDELIWIMLDKVPEDVRLIIFVIAAYSGGHLIDVDNASLHVLEEVHWNVKAQIPLLESLGDVDALAMMKRSREGSWVLSSTPQCGEPGRHFMDILEPTLGDLIRKAVPGAPAKQKVAFNMKKGATVDLPEAAKLKRVYVGVGWELARSGRTVSATNAGIDLDISAVFFSRSGRDLGAVYFDNTNEYGLIHTGDNQTGEGEGDDETITVDLPSIPKEVAQIYFVVNIYSKDTTFGLLKNAYCRVFDDTGNDLVNYKLSEQCDKSGLIISRLYRSVTNKRWGFQAIGAFCGGRTWMDPACMQDLKFIVPLSVKDVQRKQKLLEDAPHRKGVVIPHGLPTFTKKKGKTLSNGKSIAIPAVFSEKRLFVGVGWDVSRSFRRGADLDVATVFFDVDGHVDGAVYFDNPQQFGVVHSGDNMDGEGEGDDEMIQLELQDVPAHIVQIFVVVNCYSKGLTFSAVPNAFCRVCNDEGGEFIRYTLGKGKHNGKPGLLLCRLMRSPSEDGWIFEAIGKFCGGSTWMDPSCVRAMQRAFFFTSMKNQPITPRNPHRKSHHWPESPVSPRTDGTSRSESPAPERSRTKEPEGDNFTVCSIPRSFSLDGVIRI